MRYRNQERGEIKKARPLACCSSPHGDTFQATAHEEGAQEESGSLADLITHNSKSEEAKVASLPGREGMGGEKEKEKNSLYNCAESSLESLGNN